jgi:hypothetical protein
VDNQGKVKFIAGNLSDGQRLKQSATISKTGKWPLFSSHYIEKRTIPSGMTSEARGELLGWMNFVANTNAGTTNLAPLGAVSWIKTTWTNNTYTSGFTNQVSVLASRWKPAAGRVIAMTNGLATFSEGDLFSPFSAPVALATNNVLTATLPLVNNFRASLVLKNGEIKGTFNHPVTGKSSLPWYGAFLQDYNYGRGFFMSAVNSGKVTVVPQ